MAVSAEPLAGRDARSLSLLKDRVARLLGFDCSQYSDSFLMRRFDIRLRARNLSSYAEYAQLLDRDKEEWGRLQRELTIHTTNLYRDSDVWEVVTREAIPTLVDVKRRGGDRKLRCWSAGCSTGEEPVTLAICLFEALGPRLQGFDVSILATDIDEETLARARELVFEEAQFKELPPKLKERYFLPAAAGSAGSGRRSSPGPADEMRWTPVPEIGRLITFARGDLHGAKPTGFGLIACRNTVIYFDQETKKRLYGELFACLDSGGFFIMGKTETLLGPARDSFQVFNVRERIFFKE